MKKLVAVAALVSSFMLPLCVEAQMGIPQPAPELKKFERLIGNWEGSGTVTMSKGAEPTPWTCASTCQWVLDGHFLSEEMRIDFPEGNMPTLYYVNYYGWDANAQQYVAYEVANTGEVDTYEHVAWTEDDTLVLITTAVSEGTPAIERTVCRFTDGGWNFDWEIASGANPMTTVVTGTLKPAEEGFSLGEKEFAAGMVPVMPPMRKLGGMAGTYELTGQMIPAPGMPTMPISGTEVFDPVFGGSVMRMRVTGDPMPGGESSFQYQAVGFMSWNATKECYTEVYLSNMGESGYQELRWVEDDKLVTTQADMEFGNPVARRGTIKVDDTGAITKVSMERMSAGHDLEKAFVGEYTRKSEGDKEKPGKPMKPEKPEAPEKPGKKDAGAGGW